MLLAPSPLWKTCAFIFPLRRWTGDCHSNRDCFVFLFSEDCGTGSESATDAPEYAGSSTSCYQTSRAAGEESERRWWRLGPSWRTCATGDGRLGLVMCDFQPVCCWL